jgi:hypothetical protein
MENYIKGGTLGEGTFGVVYKATHKKVKQSRVEGNSNCSRCITAGRRSAINAEPCKNFQIFRVSFVSLTAETLQASCKSDLLLVLVCCRNAMPSFGGANRTP